MSIKQKITFRTVRLHYELDGPFEEAIRRLNKLKEELEAKGATEVIFDTTCEDYDEGNSIFLIGKRLETDNEQRVREDREKRENESRRAYEKKQYERLKKEFEGK